MSGWLALGWLEGWVFDVKLAGILVGSSLAGRLDGWVAICRADRWLTGWLIGSPRMDGFWFDSWMNGSWKDG